MDGSYKVPQPEDYFADESRWQSWLDVEAGLALTQSEMGMIPPEAGVKIARSAHLSRLDVDGLRSEMSRTMAPVYALSEALAKASGSAGAYVHWGATTQNIIETGRLLVLKRVHLSIHHDLERLLLLLSEQADKYADLAMVGRTNRQHALPITYGFKIAGWIDELLRVRVQLKEVEPRLFQLRFGGAIGGYHSFGEEGVELSQKLAQRFELEPSLVPNRTSIDPLLEYVVKLSMLGNAVFRMSSELYRMTGQELREIDEKQSAGVVGSSTMPHKVNPKHIVRLTAQAAQLRGQAGKAFAIPCPSHEGDTVTNQCISAAVAETCQIAMAVLKDALRTMPLMVPNATAMAQNLNSSRQMMAGEGIMMRLAKHVGRSMAHDIVHLAIEKSDETGESFNDCLKADQTLSLNFPNIDIQSLLTDDDNTGSCRDIAKNMFDHVREEISVKPNLE